MTLNRTVWNARCKNFTVSVSVDGVNYIEVGKVVDFEWRKDNLCATMTFDAMEARYVRITADGEAGQVGFGEIEVYA